MSEYILKAYNDVAKFNDIAGAFDSNHEGVQQDGVNLQLSLIFEELQETIEAFETQNEKELIDGACDLFVVVAGLLQRLHHSGFNIPEALHRVTDNNLSKFPPLDTVVLDLPVKWTCTPNYKYNVELIKDENGKIRKTSEYKPVDLTGTYPVGWFEVV